MDDLVERLITARDDDHERGCQMRFVVCSCGYDDLTARAVGDAKDHIEALQAVLDSIMIGGNHLALLIGPDHPPFTALPLDALEHYGAGDIYEIWCCWRSIMTARQALKGTDNG